MFNQHAIHFVMAIFVSLGVAQTTSAEIEQPKLTMVSYKMVALEKKEVPEYYDLFPLEGIILTSLESEVKQDLIDEETVELIKEFEVEGKQTKENYRIDRLSMVPKQTLLDIINTNGENLLTAHVDDFYEAAAKFKIDPLFLVAVAVHETGYGTSYNIKQRNNVGGVRCISDKAVKEEFNIVACQNSKSRGAFSVYASIEDSIMHKAYFLRNIYVDKGLVTIAQVGRKYAPSSDPSNTDGINSYWATNVSRLIKTNMTT
ncbi:glucosaminidase domain-containing protein [Radiobacillus sp. PE A8.2]|uniref:glucosaminidase domain-containing protein n=1 Tax=Radiobacillus sp. PE A8.2 TaxID=3380349 RepID=UPI00388E1322